MPTDPMIGEIRFWANTRAMPPGWLPCDSASLPTIGKYQSLFAVIGHTYGGSGSTFKLPDLRGRSPLGAGNAPDLSSHTPGQAGGVSEVPQVEAFLPRHKHTVEYNRVTGVGMPVAQTPSLFTEPQENGVIAEGGYTKGLSSGALRIYKSNPAPESLVTMGSLHGTATGDFKPAGTGGAVRPNRQPYMVMGFFIAYKGILPIHDH